MGRKQAGFTLIELMVTIAVLAVIVTLAVPSFQDTINSNRLTSAANETSAVLQGARMEAVRLNKAIVVCPTNVPDSGAATCAANNATAQNAARGLIAMVGGGGATIRRMTFPEGVVPRFSASFAADSGGRIVFRPDGFAHKNDGAMLNTVIGLCMAKTVPRENLRRVSLASGSRVTIKRGTDAGGAGKCSTPANTL